jgi:hypothetical protein
MPGNPRDIITVAEHRFPVRIRVAVPPGYKVETAEGVFRVRADEPTARTAANMHRTP